METKKEIRLFTIAQHKEEEEYLRRQHNAGWRFVKLAGVCSYHFEKCEPEDVVYQLDYNQEAAANKEAYIRMFADCGWEYIQEAFGYSYFRKNAAEMNGEEEIFSDDSSRLAMMERVYKGRMIPLLVIFFCVLLPQFVNNMSRGNYGVAGFLAAVLVLYIVVFTWFAIRYYRQKK